jgi:hypothetical protein
MCNKNIDLESYFIQRTISKFPIALKPILAMIYDDLRRDDTQRKSRFVIGTNIDSKSINIIPGDSEGDCSEILVAICYDDDDFDERFKTFLKHANITCKDINQELFLFTTQWNTVVFNKYIGELQAIRRNGLVVNLIYVTNKGITLMPV